MSCKSVASRTVKSCINHNQSRPNVASLSAAQWIAMPSQDWSSLTLNISGLDFCGVHTAAGCRRSCFICRVWHVCFHANSRKHHGCCQKCQGGENRAQNSLRSLQQVALLNACNVKIEICWVGWMHLLSQQKSLVTRKASQVSDLAPFICQMSCALPSWFLLRIVCSVCFVKPKVCLNPYADVAESYMNTQLISGRALLRTINGPAQAWSHVGHMTAVYTTWISGYVLLLLSCIYSLSIHWPIWTDI